MWFTGRPLAQGANAKDGLGTSGQDYVDKFSAALAQAQAQQAQASQATPAAGAAANDSPQAGASSQVPQGVIDKFQGDNPNDVGDETRLPDGSFRMDADPKGLAWAAQNAGTYGLAADPNDPSRFAAAGSAAGPGAPAANAPAARQQALTAQLPQGPAAASTAKIDLLPYGDPAKLDYYLRMQALATQSGNEGYAALFKQKAEIEKGALTPTTAQKNYEYYVRQELGAGRAPLSFRDYTNGTGDASNAPAPVSAATRVGAVSLPPAQAAPAPSTVAQAQAATGLRKGNPSQVPRQSPRFRRACRCRDCRCRKPRDCRTARVSSGSTVSND